MLFTFVIIRGLLEQDRIFNCFGFVFYIYFVVQEEDSISRFNPATCFERQFVVLLILVEFLAMLFIFCHCWACNAETDLLHVYCKMSLKIPKG
jgi:hypothetical protein